MAADLRLDPNLLPKSDVRGTAASDSCQLLPPEAGSYASGQYQYLAPVNPQQPTPPECLSNLQSPTTSSRLAGEPAYCAGRHCCHWTVAGCVCNNHYASAAELDKHIASDHAGRSLTGQPNGNYHCFWAGCSKHESFGNKPKLTRHIHSHTGYKPHRCLHPGCSKGFVTKEQLRNHETTHTKTKEHICPECGRGFAVKTALSSHINVHRGAKPYVCDECGKGFADSSNLSKHKAIHKKTSVKRRRGEGHTHCDSCTSICTTPALTSPNFTATSVLNPLYMPNYATPSIEPSMDPCSRPCFDVQCPDQDRIPCRSVSPCKSAPCSNRDCSPATIEPCDFDICTQECAQLCNQDCTQDCQDCFPECFDDCHAQFCHEDYCHTSHECPVKPPQSACPALSPQTTPSQSTAQSEESYLNPSAAIATDSFQSLDGTEFDFNEGFKQLTEFVHSDFCDCMEETLHSR